MTRPSTQSNIESPWPSLSALWSLLWRAVLLAPLVVILTAAWILAWAALVALPVLEFMFVRDKDWLFAAFTPLLWALLFWFIRWNRFKLDRRYFPNEQDNI